MGALIAVCLLHIMPPYACHFMHINPDHACQPPEGLRGRDGFDLQQVRRQSIRRHYHLVQEARTLRSFSGITVNLNAVLRNLERRCQT